MPTVGGDSSDGGIRLHAGPVSGTFHLSLTRKGTDFRPERTEGSVVDPGVVVPDSRGTDTPRGTVVRRHPVLHEVADKPEGVAVGTMSTPDEGGRRERGLVLHSRDPKVEGHPVSVETGHLGDRLDLAVRREPSCSANLSPTEPTTHYIREKTRVGMEHLVIGDIVGGSVEVSGVSVIKKGP